MTDPRLTRITVNLTPRGRAALDQVVQTTGETQTDVINAAVRLYSWYLGAADHGLLRVLGSDGRPETVLVL